MENELRIHLSVFIDTIEEKELSCEFAYKLQEKSDDMLGFPQPDVYVVDKAEVKLPDGAFLLDSIFEPDVGNITFTMLKPLKDFPRWDPQRDVIFQGLFSYGKSQPQLQVRFSEKTVLHFFLDVKKQ